MAKNTVVELESDELLALAKLDIEKGDIEKGLLKLKRVLGSSEPPVESISMAARLYAQLGLFERAQALYQQFLKACPDAELELFQLGMTHYDSGQSEEASCAWEQILEKNPTHPPALFYKALVLAQSNKTADARQAVEILLQSVPADNLYFSRGKELLATINSGNRPDLPSAKQAESKQSGRILPKDAYQTEH